MWQASSKLLSLPITYACAIVYDHELGLTRDRLPGPAGCNDMLNVPITSQTRLIGRHNASCKDAKRPEQPRPVSSMLKGLISGQLDLGLNS